MKIRSDYTQGLPSGFSQMHVKQAKREVEQAKKEKRLQKTKEKEEKKKELYEC